MLNKLVSWLRTEARREEKQGRWARWVGRNWAHFTYARRVEPTWLEVNHHDVPITDLPPSFMGLRIVQMSDFHCGRHVTPTYLAEAVELAQGQRGDLIVLTGDFIHKGFKHVGHMAKVLGRLSCGLGVYAVLGNHDFSVRNALGVRRYRDLYRAVAQALTDQGIRVLHNETVPLERDGATVLLTGVDDLWSRVCDLDRAYADHESHMPRVILAHNPSTVEYLNGRRCDLMLSGHTHGGQINLPGLGRVTLGPKGRRFAAGMYYYRQTILYVNKGVGFGFRVRYGVRPEVAVFTLQTLPSPSSSVASPS